MPLFGNSESKYDGSQNIQLTSLNQRLSTIEAYNAGNRLGVLEAVNTAARLSALELLNAGSRLSALETGQNGLTQLVTANLDAVDVFADDLESHLTDRSNPHQVTLLQIGGEPSGAELRAKTYTDQKVTAAISAHKAETEPHTKFIYRMKCGATVPFGNDWRAETTAWVAGGTTYDILQQFPSTPLATNTFEPYIYRHERSGSSAMTYNIPVRKGIYTVRLHFCENYENNVGARVMSSIKINDITKLTNFDILAQAAKYQALIKEFNNIDCSSTAFCKIALSSGLINGIELIQSN